MSIYWHFQFTHPRTQGKQQDGKTRVGHKGYTGIALPIEASCREVLRFLKGMGNCGGWKKERKYDPDAGKPFERP